MRQTTCLRPEKISVHGMVRASCVGRPARWKGTILRLTRIASNDPGVTLRAEGRVAGEWSMLLERECAAAAGEFGVVHLDLAAVAYVDTKGVARSEEHTSELQSQSNLVCRLLLEKKKTLTSLMLSVRPTHQSAPKSAAS